ncbi:DUF4390 domain-containing protein [Herminiimonas sp.]|uniref:DUF4390 domain-containing protein n=1 Tax=Herminiimonas sp. TaxID=1926289 RepID=UPI00351F2FA2
MKKNFSTSLYWLCATLLLAFSLQLVTAQAADGIEIEQAHLEDSSEGYRLSSTFVFELNRGLEDALNRGIPLYFTTEIEITKPRWYWFDAKAVVDSQTIRISYNVLTRQYHAAITGRLQQSFSTLDDALSLVRRPNRWVVADRNELKVGETYSVSVRMQLDVAQLPKPFQVHALNSSDWRLTSNWKHFLYTAERQ